MSASPARFLAYAEEILAAGDRSRPISIQAAVPDLAPTDLLSGLDGAQGYFWRDRADQTAAGIGHAATITGAGDDRFAQVRDGANALFDELELHVFGDGDPLPPRLFGGFSFRAGDAQTGDWSGFGDARFLLPALSCVTVDGGSVLTLSLPAGRGAEAEMEAMERLRAVIPGSRDRARSPFGPRVPPAGAAGRTEPAEPEEGADAERYRRLVAKAVDAIRHGELEKVVLARRTSMLLAAPGVPALVRALASAEGTFRFAQAVDGALFLGTTPERLISLRGRRLHTEAVAGTTGSAGGDAALLNGGGKDRWEHELVVRAIAAALEPLATLRWDPAPVVWSAGPVRHLSTRFEATLDRDTHILELVRRLHPTPAVGGAPGPESLAWIAAHEPTPRGWYSGPIGWFDADGVGEFAVALRCGLLRGDRLELFAGSGIVAGSDPEAEYEETRLKLRALPAALGLG